MAAAAGCGRRYDALLLDFDGTLTDSLPLYTATMQQLVTEFGLRPLPDGGLEAMRALGTRELIAVLGLRWWRIPAATRRMRELVALRRGELRLFDGIAPLLQRLHAEGVQLQLVTSNARDTVETVLGPLRGCFVQLHCGVPLLGKRRALARALRGSGTAAARVLSVGDELRDAEASRALGLDFAAVSWGVGLPERLQAATALPLLRHPGELAMLVLGAAAPR